MLAKNEWWLVITSYNERIFPLQWIILIFLILLTLYLLVGDKRIANRTIKVTLGTINLFIGIVFFMMSQGFPLKLRMSQGLLFVGIGVLLIWDLYKNNYEFQFPKEGWKRSFFIIGMLLMMLYPFAGLLQGKNMNHSIVQGTLPCPTTAYTLILIITASKRKGRLLYGCLLFWAIPFPVLVQIPKYGVYEDGIMFAIGLVGLGVLIYEFVKESREEIKND